MWECFKGGSSMQCVLCVYFMQILSSIIICIWVFGCPLIPKFSSIITKPSCNFRFSGEEFPPRIVFKVFIKTDGFGVKYLCGKKVIKPASQVKYLLIILFSIWIRLFEYLTFLRLCRKVESLATVHKVKDSIPCRFIPKTLKLV